MKSRLTTTLLTLSLLTACIDIPPAIHFSPIPETPRPFAIVPLGNPRCLAIDPAGNLYVADDDGGTIFKITPAGQVSTLGTAGASLISDPLGIAAGRDGTVYVADTAGNTVYRIPPGGAAVAYAKTPDAFKSPTGIAVDSAGNAFITNNADNSILKITPDGTVSIFAGTSGAAGSTDGKADVATFLTPRGIGIDAQNNLYVADEGNCNIRKITPAGIVTTLAGKAGQSGSADGTGAAATFGAPRSLSAAADGTVFVADTDNHLIRKITPAGLVTTLAGKPGETGKADGPSAAARFTEPRGTAVDTAGNVYVVDTGNASIRQITPNGQVTTIAAPTPPATAPATSPKP